MRKRGDTHFFPLYWWRQIPNFGDHMSAAIVDRLLKYLGYNTTTVVHIPLRGLGRRVLALGSIIDHAMGKDVIWGSGIIRENVSFSNPMIDVRALRGKKSEEFLLKRGAIQKGQVKSFGDPFLLFPLLFPELVNQVHEKIYDFLVVPNHIEYSSYLYNDQDLKKLRLQGKKIEVVDM